MLNQSLSITEELNVIIDARAKVALWEYIVVERLDIELKENEAILRGIQVNLKFLLTEIVSNLRKKLLNYLARK